MMYCCLPNDLLVQFYQWWYRGQTNRVLEEVPYYPVNCPSHCRCGRWGGPNYNINETPMIGCCYGAKGEIIRNIPETICPIHTQGADKPVYTIYYNDEVWSPICQCK